MTLQRSLTLIGGPPWGFRISGGNDQDYPPHVSQVKIHNEVISQSRASQEGMQAGDVVLALNGKSVETFSQNDVQRLLKKANGSLRVLVQRSTSPLITTDSNNGRNSSIDEEKEPILQQPKNTSQQPYRRKRADSVESEISGSQDVLAKKPPLSIRSVTNSQENLSGLGKPPLPWGSSTNRQWAPLHFSPMTTSLNANYSQLNGESSSTTKSADIFDFRKNYQVRSAPVTPMSPLSPVYNGWTTNQMFPSRENLTVAPHLELVIETSCAHRSPNSSSVTPKKTLLSEDNNEFKPKCVTPNFASISPISTTSTLAERTASSSNQKLNNVDDSGVNNLSHSSANPGEPSGNGISSDNIFVGNTDIEKERRDDVAFDGNATLLPDDIAFRPDSICSDHPSLATGSIIGVDMESVGSQAADSEVGLDSAIASSTPREDGSAEGPFFVTARKFSGRNRPLPVILDVSSPSTTDQAMAESVSSSFQTDPGVKDSNSLLMTDSVSFGDDPSLNDSTTTNPQNKVAESLPNQRPGDISLPDYVSNDDITRQPHYPLAFSPENVSPLETSASNVGEVIPTARTHGASTQTKPPPQLSELFNDGFTTSTTAATIVPSSTAMTSSVYQPFSSTGFVGPSFKAAASAQPAVWTPGNKQQQQSSSIPAFKQEPSSLLSPLTSYSSSSVPGYSPVNFIPSETNFSSPAYHNVQPARGTHQFSNHGVSENIILTSPKSSAPVFAAPPPPPPSQSSVNSSASPLSPISAKSIGANTDGPLGSNVGASAPPPPPPPPVPGAVSGRIPLSEKNRLTAEEAAIAADPNRSVVEYPEKQSVASLRSAIESKLNGSPPVKGVFTGVTTSTSSGGETKSSSSLNNIVDKVDLVNSAVEGLKNAVFGAKQTSDTSSLKVDLSRSGIDELEKAISGNQSSTTALLNTGASNKKHDDEEAAATQNYNSMSSRTATDSSADRSFATTPSQYWSAAGKSSISSEPVRPHPPPDLKSPTPPKIPPSPVKYAPLSTTSRPDNYSRPYDYNNFAKRSPPRGSTLVDRQSTIENDHIRTDSYFSVPYRELQNTKRQIKQSDMKYDGVGPTDDRDTPLGLKQLVDEKGYQHQWYKMMYKKLHQIDKREEDSVLRYQMRDYLGDRYVNQSHTATPRRRRNDEENNPYTVTYKFADYVADQDMDYDPGYIPQPSSYSSTTLPNRNSRKNDRDFAARSTRSKSAGRYEPASPPPPTDIIRSSTPGERYKHQPKRIEDYIPGTSSIAEYEQEKIIKDIEEKNNSIVSPTTREKSYDVVNEAEVDSSILKKRVITELIGKHRNVAAAVRPQSSLAYTSASRFLGTTDEEPPYRRRDLSPPSRDEARQWYRNVQAGGEVPFSGLRQPAPERRDSWLRTALLTTLKYRRKLNDVVEKRESAVQTNGQTFEIVKSKSPPTKKLLHYGVYWKRAFQTPPSPTTPPSFRPIHHQSRRRYDSPLYVETRYHNDFDDDMRPSKSSNSYFSPVRGGGGYSKRYALERMRTKDFHIPEYRKGRSGSAPSASSPSAATTTSKSVDYEIEAYFDYLKLFCEEENERLLSKAVQSNDGSLTRNGGGDGGYYAYSLASPKRQPWSKHYEKSLRRHRRDELTFDQTCKALQNAIHEIDILASGSNQNRVNDDESRRRSNNKNLRSKHSPVPQTTRTTTTSTKEEISPRSLLRRSASLPTPLIVNDLSCINDKTIPFKGILKNSTPKQPFSLAVEQKVGVEWLPTVFFASAIPLERTAIKRVHSLPQISEKSSDSLGGAKQSKSMDSFNLISKTGNGYDKYSSSEAGETDVSLESDVMEISFDDDGRVKLTNSRERTGEQNQLPFTYGYRRLTSPWSDAVSVEPLPHKSTDYSRRYDRSYAAVDSFGRSLSTPNIRHDLRIFSAAPSTTHFYPQPPASLLYHPTIYRPPSTSVLDCMFSSIAGLQQQQQQPQQNINTYGSEWWRFSAAELLRVKQVVNASGPRFHNYSSLASTPLSFIESPTRTELNARYKALSAMKNYERTPYEIEELAKLEKELIVEEERRKKYEREIEDQRSRRHGYIPLQIKTPILTDQRFEKLITDYGKRAPPVPSAPAASAAEFRGVARAVYGFTAHAPRELSFFKGDLIKIRRIIDENWYEGEIKGRVGIIPSNYVELVAAADGEERVVLTEVSRSAEGQAQVLFNFDGRKMNELPLRKNEFITLTRKIDDNWYEGRNDSGRRGIFPSNYVRILSEPSSQVKDFVSAFSPPQATSTPSKSNEFKLQVNGVQYDSKEKHSSSRFDKSLSTPPTSFKSLDTKAQENNFAAVNGKQSFNSRSGHFNQPETYQTLYAYKPQNPDELELREGDIVYVVEKCDDGWYIGTSLRTGKFGTFPGNYVKVI